MRALLVGILLLGVAPMGDADVRGEEITYSGDGVEMKGYIAWDSALEGKRPGVLVVHEWWGHNDYARERARQLAEAGYTALALDMYGGGKGADHPQGAGEFMNAVLADLPGMRARFEAADQVLRAHETVDADRVAAIGYCFGGGVVLHMARVGHDLDAVASFHGSLGLAVVEDAPEQIQARVVAYNGEADPFTSAEAVANFKTEMDQAGADWQFINYPGAVHGFTNPAATANGEKFGLPLRYNRLADESSWAHMLLLFQDTFRDHNEASSED